MRPHPIIFVVLWLWTAHIISIFFLHGSTEIPNINCIYYSRRIASRDPPPRSSGLNGRRVTPTDLPGDLRAPDAASTSRAGRTPGAGPRARERGRCREGGGAPGQGPWGECNSKGRPRLEDEREAHHLLVGQEEDGFGLEVGGMEFPFFGGGSFLRGQRHGVLDW